jgi:hypothetical protein
VLFVKVSVKTIESFSSIIVNELTCGLTSDSDEMKTEAERLMRAAMVAIPGTFQFAEFAFLPDLITFPEVTDSKEGHWPLIKGSSDSLEYLTTAQFDQKAYESQLVTEFLSLEDV